MPLHQHSSKLWTDTTDVRLPGGVIFPTRMTVADVGGGELLIHSPIPLDDAAAAEIEALGEVRWILAPNDFHHMWVPDAARRFPSAEVWGTPGAISKQKEVEFSGSLLEGQPTDLPESAVVMRVAGMPAVNETALWLPEASTMVTTDLVFNIDDPANLRTRFVLWLIGLSKPEVAQSRTEKWIFVRDRPSYAESLADILQRPFDRLVMAHGEVVEEGGSESLRRAVDWALDETKRIAA